MKRAFKIGLLLFYLLCSMTAPLAYAQENRNQRNQYPTIANVARNIRGSFGNIAKLVVSSAYLAGMGFAIAAILKFKAHKDNPTQIPVGTPLAYFFIAGCFLFLPGMFQTVGETFYGDKAKSYQGSLNGGGVRFIRSQEQRRREREAERNQ